MEQLGNITLHQGDCMDILRSLPDKSFDLAIVDPPYFSGPERRGFYGKRYSTTGIERIDYHKCDKWQVPGQDYFMELERVSRYYIVWGCNYFITGHTYLAALSDRGHCLYGLCSDVLFHNVYMGFTKPPKALFLIVDIANYLNFIIV